MAEHVHPRVLDRAQDPIGHLRLFLVEPRVDRDDDDVELGETVVGEIQPAVSQDFALDAGEELNAGAPDVLPYRLGMREGARFVQAASTMASDRLWSVTAKYSSPAAFAARAIV